MYTLSYTLEVNPAGATPKLTQDQVWRGLVMKAENALPFVPTMSRCDLIERTENTILREVAVGPGVFREFITLYPPVQVQFERVGGGGFIQNTISESQRGLLLTFTFALSFPGTAPGSPEERAQGEGMRQAYVEAVGATLKQVRAMASRGEL